MTLVYTIIAFGIMVFVHELGHFLVARAFGVGIESFSLGFGKPVFMVKRKGIEYRVGWIPLGGYVKMQGENPGDPDQNAARSFRGKAWWKRALIGLSGPFANLLFGLLLFIISFILPVRYEDQRPVVHSAAGKWAQVIAPGDSIVSFGGKAVRGFTDFLEKLVAERSGTLVLQRSGQRIDLPVAGADADSLALSLLPEVDTRVGEVLPKTPAYHAKLLPGDRILKVDGTGVSDWYFMREMIVNSVRDSVTLTVSRQNQILVKKLPLESSLATGAAKTVGILQNQPLRYERRFSPGEAVRLGTLNTVSFLVMNYRALFELAKKPAELRKSVGGPVMIVSLSQQMARKGFGTLLLFFGGISLMLMFMNLLPIPILDGGLVLFCVIEGLRRRPIPLKLQSILQSIGLVLLLGLMVLAFYSDISSELMRFMSR